MVNKELFAALRMLQKEKGISMDVLCEGIQRALVTAVKRDYNNKDIVFCELNPEDETMRVFVRKNVVSEISDPDEDILVEQAQKYKPTAMPGDIIEIELETKEVSRIAADKGKHVIRQGIREAEHGKMREEIQSKNQEIVTAKVSRIDPETGDAIVEIGKSQELLLKSEQIPGEVLAPGDLIKVYVADVRDNLRRMPRATISRTHPGLVRRLFETEVPEIYDGTVEIKSVSREAGSRTKIAVYSSDENVDAVGACIGPRGARVGKVVDLLGGEKIDIVKYSENPAEFIAAALAPADVVSVTVDESGEKSCKVIVPDMQLSLAIGNRGQNARLAAKLTGWKIDIKPESGKEAPSIVL
ncbi:MAG: transcription termination factor NusA [Oscillospiraceae bacterium]|jgi:N utilization substance protein A|nr:transcription termination factor NusA [Ruminococcus sp.]MDD7337739.1 transcription termination factor NusA [Ruminococcus sp.]MDY6061802.1 transcription termination factor NusA [Oscillospiraceae bacterium]